MRVKMLGLFVAVAVVAFGTQVNAALISEFEPNPAGTDPASMNVELLGTPSAAFDLWLISIESDPGSTQGRVDRFTNVTGSYDGDGRAVVSVPDFENPSNTVLLTTSFSGDNSTDIDPSKLGASASLGDLNLTAFGTIEDALGVPDNVGDESTIYGAVLGGNDLAYNGHFEPLLAFRDGTSYDWYQTVTVDFGDPSEHIAVFGQSGGAEISAAAFDIDPTAPTFGSVNPSLVPEPTSIALLVAGLIAAVSTRRK